MVFYLVNLGSRTERNIVVIALVLLLQEINAYTGTTKKELRSLEEYSEHTDNLMEHGLKDDKMVKAELFDNSYGNYLMQKDITGHVPVEDRQQNRLERSVNDVDTNKKNIFDNLKLASSYPSCMAQSMRLWQQGPAIGRRTFHAVPAPRMKFVDPSLIQAIPLQQYYRFNTPSKFYNMPMPVQRRSTRPNIRQVDPGFDYRNSKYAVDYDVGLDHNTNSDIFKDAVRPADSFEMLGRKRRKHITYRLVPVTAAEAQNVKECKPNGSPLETFNTPVKPLAPGKGDSVIENQNKIGNVNETKSACIKPDVGSAQYQVIMTKPSNKTEKINTTCGSAESTKKNMLNEIISELAEFKPHDNSNMTELRDNMPCSILGSWISEAGGVRLDIVKSGEKGMVNVTIANTIPPTPCPWLNKTEWNIDGEIPLTEKGVFTLTAIHKVRHKLATFVGQCMRCNGEDLVAGVWSTGRTSRNCRDTMVSYGEKPDVLHKEVLHLLRAQKRKDLELRALSTTQSTCTDHPKAVSKGWWEY